MLIAIRAHHLLRVTAMRAAGAAFCTLLQFGFGPGAPIAPGWLIDWFVRIAIVDAKLSNDCLEPIAAVPPCRKIRPKQYVVKRSKNSNSALKVYCAFDLILGSLRIKNVHVELLLGWHFDWQQAKLWWQNGGRVNRPYSWQRSRRYASAYLAETRQVQNCQHKQCMENSG